MSPVAVVMAAVMQPVAVVMPRVAVVMQLIAVVIQRVIHSYSAITLALSYAMSLEI